jgi:hypothetical protein
MAPKKQSCLAARRGARSVEGSPCASCDRSSHSTRTCSVGPVGSNAQDLAQLAWLALLDARK